MNSPRFLVAFAGMMLLFFGAGPAVLIGQVFDEQFDHWPVDHRINGTVMLAPRLDDPAILKPTFEDLSEKKVHLIVEGETEHGDVISLMDLFAENDNELTIESAGDDFAEQLTSALDDCDIFCWVRKTTWMEPNEEAFSDVRKGLMGHVDKGGLLLVIGPHAARFGSAEVMVENDDLALRDGFGLLADCIVRSDFDNSSAHRGELLSVLARNPRRVGLGLSERVVLVLSRRKCLVVGDGNATFMLMANERQPIRSQTIAAATGRRQAPQEFLVDLTEWRRDAIDRTIDVFPPAEPLTPNVENGTLLIVGGGGMPEGLMSKFIELAGGVENARLVYVPCSEQDETPRASRMVETWKRMGVEHATFIHTKDRTRANEDEEFFAPLKEATGIWFGGGRQWNFADSYYGTRTHELMKDVLRRGGVIGGSSAGASIQARYLARATPIGNFRIMAPGYERGGLGFISGVAIDQHFSQRGRQKDMTRLVNRYPQMLGIGIDEATALVVSKSVAEVVGSGKVFFYDRNEPVYPDRPDYIALPSGSSYDLAKREVLVDATESQDTEAGTSDDD